VRFSGKPHRYVAQVTCLRDFGFSIDIAALGMSAMVPLSLLEDDHYRHDPVAKHPAPINSRHPFLQLGRQPTSPLP
jgi:exoribonuclease R